MGDDILELRLLGGFEAWRGDEPVALAPAAAELLSLLALRQRRSHRSIVAGTLWPDKTESRASANLRGSVWRLPEHGQRIVSSVRGILHLSDEVKTDIDTLEESSKRLIGGNSPAPPFDPVVYELEKDLLPGWDQVWVVIERERIRQLRLYALEALSAQLVELGRIGQAVVAALAAVRADPLRESAHRTLIMAHIADGNRCEALRQYERFRDLMTIELGVGPTQSLVKMMDAIHE